MKIAKLHLIYAVFLVSSAILADESMKGMTGPNYLLNGRFEDTVDVAYPWTGVDEKGFLRKSVQNKGVNIFVTKSNEFSYDYLANSASFVDVDGDGLPDIVAPDGAGFFWFWKNVGTPGNPQFAFGEVMPLLVDNERSTYATVVRGDKKSLSASEQREKDRIDDKRKAAIARIERENKSKPQGQQWTTQEIEDRVKADLPYPWEVNQTSQTGPTRCELNGFRQLRAVAAPYDLDHRGLVDFVVGDAQGSIYVAQNTGRRGQPNYRTYTKTDDSLILKLFPSYDLLTKKTTLQPVNFMNYATPFVCDWNGDGFPDLLVGEGTYSVNAIRLFLNPFHSRGLGGNLPQECILMVGESSTFLSPFAWDWDGDGYLDLFVNDSEGHLKVFPNPGGKYCSGKTEMTEYKNITFEGQPNNDFLKYCCPQPCDWNNDGVMDLIWSDPFGRIFYALGKEKGGTVFGPPTPVKSIALKALKHLSIPKDVGFCAVGTKWPDKGGTGDAERYISQAGGEEINGGGYPAKLDKWYGLMPGWDPDPFLEKEGRETKFSFLPVKTAASWAIAPVPYEVFNVVKDLGGGNGEGNTFTLTWHNPADNYVFKQPRDAVTKFGQGAAFLFEAQGKKGDLIDANVRVSFFMKLEGKFDTLNVLCRTDYIDGGRRLDGGEMLFKSLPSPPIGQWFHYESVFAKGKFPRQPGFLEISLSGRGNVSIRDVAYSTTDMPPDNK